MMGWKANNIFYDISNHSGRKSFLRGFSRITPTNSTYLAEMTALTRRENRRGEGGGVATGPHQVFGGTVLFARGPSVESWPWWTGPAAPAELQRKEKKKKSVRGESVRFGLRDGSETSCARLWCALHYITHWRSREKESRPEQHDITSTSCSRLIKSSRARSERICSAAPPEPE